MLKMGRKWLLSHKSKRTQAMNSSGRPSKRDHNPKQYSSFMDLPPEILDAIVRDLKLHDLAVLVQTSRTVSAYLEPWLYKKIYTRRDTPHDTKGLVSLL